MNNFIDNLNENKFFTGCMMIIVTIGGRFIITELSDKQKELIHHPIFKKILIFCAFFMATRDIQCATILTILFVLIVGELFNGDFLNNLPKKNENNNEKIDQMIEELTSMKM
tara:strand:+ start:223 stop:558 length:336 start_codon:yes stop_codon:yes gene_type:complete